MRVSRTVLGGALGETPEVYSLHGGPLAIPLKKTSMRPPASPLDRSPIRRPQFGRRQIAFSQSCPPIGADCRQTLAISPASLFLGELTRVLTGHASILSAGYCLSTARASSTVPTSHAS
jgi:hypothetical protein